MPVRWYDLGTVIYLCPCPIENLSSLSLASLLSQCWSEEDIFSTSIFGPPKPVPISTYLCPDGSHYVVIKNEEAVIVSGNTFARVEETSRFSNGAYEVDLTPDTFTLRDLETNEEVATCVAGVPEAGLPPILTEQQ